MPYYDEIWEHMYCSKECAFDDGAVMKDLQIVDKKDLGYYTLNNSETCERCDEKLAKFRTEEK